MPVGVPIGQPVGECRRVVDRWWWWRLACDELARCRDAARPLSGTYVAPPRPAALQYTGLPGLQGVRSQDEPVFTVTSRRGRSRLLEEFSDQKRPIRFEALRNFNAVCHKLRGF